MLACAMGAAMTELLWFSGMVLEPIAGQVIEANYDLREL